jgi:AraC family cel operon transcriptional repressor
MLVPPQTMMAVFEYLGPSFQPERLLEPQMPVIANLNLDDYERVLVQFEQLVLDNQIRGSRSDALFRYTLLSVLFNCFPVNRMEGSRDIPLWLHGLCLDMMRESHFVEGLPALYRLANKSKEHISRSFRKYLDKSPTEFINDLRLDASARKIVSTEAKIVDICEEVGFESVSHYYHLFLKKFGMSPKDFRIRAASGSIDENVIGVYPLDIGIPDGIPFDED